MKIYNIVFLFFLGILIVIAIWALVRSEPYQEARKYLDPQGKELLDICLNKRLHLYNGDMCTELRHEVEIFNKVLERRKQLMKHE